MVMKLALPTEICDLVWRYVGVSAMCAEKALHLLPAQAWRELSKDVLIEDEVPLLLSMTPDGQTHTLTLVKESFHLDEKSRAVYVETQLYAVEIDKAPPTGSGSSHLLGTVRELNDGAAFDLTFDPQRPLYEPEHTLCAVLDDTLEQRVRLWQEGAVVHPTKWRDTAMRATMRRQLAKAVWTHGLFG
jgi:hypothetical protein